MAGTILEVPWQGEDPEAGDLLAQRRGKLVWVIDAVERIAERADGCRLRLTVHTIRRPARCVVHSHNRIAHQRSPGDPPDVRQGRPGGRTAVVSSEWRDPDDISPTASRTPRQVRGWHTFCPLERMRSAGSRITSEHIAAANVLRAATDAASYGFTTLRDLNELATGLPGPSTGPSEAAKKQAVACGVVQRALAPFDLATVAMLNAILIENTTINAWCAARTVETGRRYDPAQYIGSLMQCLDILVKHFGQLVDQQDDEQERKRA